MKRAGHLVDISNFEELATAIKEETGFVNGDAFARQRIANPFTLFDSKQVLDNAPLYFDEAEVSGSGTGSSWSKDRASTTLTTTAVTAGKRVRQTKMRFPYQPGKSLMGIYTFVAKTDAGNTAEVGSLYNDNGVFLRINGGAELVVRSNVTGSPVDTTIPQASWNLDKMDGSGDSGITIDWTKAQIFFLDLEWLGVGTVAFGFFINRTPYYVHFQHHANNIDSVYMSTANLPVHYSLENDGTGGAATFEHICSTVISEGGLQERGVIRSVDRGIISYSTGNNSSIHPILSMRLKSTHLGATVIPNFMSVINTTSVDFRWILLLNPTVANPGTNDTWISLDNGAVEYNIARDNTNTLTDGYQLASGYSSDTQNQFANEIENALTIGSAIDGTRDELVLAVQNISGNNETYYGALTFRELH